MKKWHSILGSPWKFQRAKLRESTEELRNPGRGWYQVHTFVMMDSLSIENLERCVEKGDALALVLIDIGEYRAELLSKECLSLIDRILDCFVAAEVDIILRVAYDHEGKAWEREPVNFDQVKRHLAQLGPVLEKYAEYIFVYQGLLVGNWGEMHSSRFMAVYQLEQLAIGLEQYLGGKSFLAVRRPVQWRELNYWARRTKDYSRTRMGLFDDGILGSETDLGTFGMEPRSEAGWGDSWRTDDELIFEGQLCRYVPQGGEALYQEGVSEKRSLQETVERLRWMNICYLNRVHDQRILELWKQMTWKGQKPWAGMNGYDYIGRHLGYRFCVRNVNVCLPEEDEKDCWWQVTVENTGFARCYQEVDAWLEWKDPQGRNYTKTLSLELHRLLPGQVQTGNCAVSPMEGEVYLHAACRKDGRVIYFANRPAEGTGVLLGRLARQ